MNSDIPPNLVTAGLRINVWVATQSSLRAYLSA
jgi:hypothetical protein